jgi:hypothetical protein
MGTGSFPGVQRLGRGADHPPLLVPRSRKSRAIPLLPLWAFGACYRVNLIICLTTKEKHGKTSVRVVEKCPDILVAAVQYTFTHKQYTEQQNETEYTERNIHNNQNN